jgi:hypothetical protein
MRQVQWRWVLVGVAFIYGAQLLLAAAARLMWWACCRPASR